MVQPNQPLLSTSSKPKPNTASSANSEPAKSEPQVKLTNVSAISQLAGTNAKPTAPSPVVRTVLPALSPFADAKASAAVLPVPPAPSKTDFKMAAGEAPATTLKPEPTKTEPQPQTTNASDEPKSAAATTAAPTKPEEKLGKKLRTKAEILGALRVGSRVVHTSAGLYRIVAADGTQSPASKRRVLALLEQKILKATNADHRAYVLGVEAETKAVKNNAGANAKVSAIVTTAIKDTK